MELLKNKARKIILNMIYANYQLIEVRPGACRYNYRCQMNAVHDAIENGDDKLAMVFYINNDYPILHFINVNNDGVFLDNTLGNWSTQYDYFFIRYIDKNSYYQINSIFDNFRNELQNRLPLYVRLFNNKEW